MSVDSDVSNITQLILNFYNKDFNINEENPLTEKKNLHKNTDIIFKTLFLTEHQHLEETPQLLKLTKQNPKKIAISKMNFIQDKIIFDKIIKYKLLEIKKQITILEYILVLYKYNVITLLHKSSDFDKDKDDICNYYIQILKQYINEYITREEENNLKKALEAYTKMLNFNDTLK